MKPIVALYKTYRGGEWFEASLESVRTQCAGAVVVASTQPWRGIPGAHPPENCLEPLARFRARHPAFPVMLIRPGERQDTAEQYQTGMQEIRRQFGHDHGVLLVDTDEVWEEAGLIALRRAMTEHKNALCFRCGIWTYLRSPLWRIAPQEQARVAVGLAKPRLPTGISRLANIYELYSREQIYDVPGCNFHHFAYVRLDPEEITAKLVNCTSQDRVPVRPNWKETVWDSLPAGVNLHPQKGFEKCWPGVDEIDKGELPAAVASSDAYWAGLVWSKPEQVRDLFTEDSPTWRREAEAMPVAACPATTVPAGMETALQRLAAIVGQPIDRKTAQFLLPRLRMSFREFVQLAMLAAQVPSGGIALEIGSGHGGSMAAMMLACPPEMDLIGVDPYQPYDEDNDIMNRGVQEGSADAFHETVDTIKAAGVRFKLVSLHRASSAVVAGGIPVNSLDLCLIDGNHSYAFCKEDLELWWPAVKPGGLVLVHDYATRFPGVIRAVKEFEADQGVTFFLPLRSTLAWLRKPQCP